MKITLHLWATATIAFKRLLAQRGLALATLLGLVAAMSLTMSIPLYAEGVYYRILSAGLFSDTPRYRGQSLRPPLALLFRYTGSGWHLSTSKAPMAVSALEMRGPNRGWAVGGSIHSGYVLEYVAGTWREVPDLDVPILEAVSAVSDDEAWAVGSYGAVLHGEAGVWSEVEVPTGKRCTTSTW